MTSLTESDIRTRILSELAEVAVEASLEGDEGAVRQVVDYVADNPEELATVFSLALRMSRERARRG